MDSIQLFKLLQILIRQFQEHLVQQAAINDLPEPKDLPEDFDELVKFDPHKEDDA